MKNNKLRYKNYFIYFNISNISLLQLRFLKIYKKTAYIFPRYNIKH